MQNKFNNKHEKHRLQLQKKKKKLCVRVRKNLYFSSMKYGLYYICFIIIFP